MTDDPRMSPEMVREAFLRTFLNTTESELNDVQRAGVDAFVAQMMAHYGNPPTILGSEYFAALPSVVEKVLDGRETRH